MYRIIFGGSHGFEHRLIDAVLLALELSEVVPSCTVLVYEDDTKIAAFFRGKRTFPSFAWDDPPEAMAATGGQVK